MVIKTHLHLPWSYEKWLKTNFFQKIHTFEVLNNLAAHLLILEIFSYYVTLVFGPTRLLKFRCAFLHAYGAPYFFSLFLNTFKWPVFITIAKERALFSCIFVLASKKKKKKLGLKIDENFQRSCINGYTLGHTPIRSRDYFPHYICGYSAP